MFIPAADTAVAATKHVPNDMPTQQETSNKPTLLIDKVSLTINITDPGHQKHILGTLIGMSKHADHPFPQYGWASGVRRGYKAALRIHFPNPLMPDVHGPWTTQFALAQAAPKNMKGGYLRLEWNPRAISEQQSGHLFEQLSAVLSIEPPDLLQAKVTRLDIAVDLPGMRPGDYVWERPKSPLRRPLFNKGILETLYLGSSFKGQVTVYDKGVVSATSAAAARLSTCSTLSAASDRDGL